MVLELQGELLGLGSIVRLERETGAGLFVVLARGAFRPDSEEPGVEARYLVAPHPYGEAPDQETFPVLAREIQEIVFEGYSDGDDEAFLADLLDQMENGRRVTVRAEQFDESLTEIPERRDGEADAGSVRVSADPFFALRRLMGRNDRKDA